MTKIISKKGKIVKNKTFSAQYENSNKRWVEVEQMKPQHNIMKRNVIGIG